MKIGLLFGSFNPVHHGHLLVATRLREAAGLDEVWLVVSPQNPHKESSGLEKAEHRLRMTQLAVADHPFLRCADIEFGLPLPSYTYRTLEALREQHPEDRFSLIVGADNIAKLHTWKEIETIEATTEILVYDRVGAKHDTTVRHRPVALPLTDISATEIRERIRDGKTIRYFVPDPVIGYIRDKGLYK